MAGKPKVFVTRRIPAAGLDRICQQCDTEVWPEQMPPPFELMRQKIAACDGLVSLLTDRIDPALMDAAPRLKVVSNYAVGFNNIDVAAATARGIAVGNTPGVLAAMPCGHDCDPPRDQVPLSFYGRAPPSLCPF